MTKQYVSESKTGFNPVLKLRAPWYDSKPGADQYPKPGKM